MAVRRRLKVIVVLAALIGLALGGTAHAAGPASDPGRHVSAARWVEVTFVNNTYLFLNRVSESLPHGKWNVHPPLVIAGQDVRIWGSESNGLFTGTEGYTTYRTNEGGDLLLGWNNPYAGSNSYDCIPPGGMTCRITGGGGNGARVRFDLRFGG